LDNCSKFQLVDITWYIGTGLGDMYADVGSGLFPVCRPLLIKKRLKVREGSKEDLCPG